MRQEPVDSMRLRKAIAHRGKDVQSSAGSSVSRSTSGMRACPEIISGKSPGRIFEKLPRDIPKGLLAPSIVSAALCPKRLRVGRIIAIPCWLSFVSNRPRHCRSL